MVCRCCLTLLWISAYRPENVLLKHDPGTEYGVVAKITE